MAEEVRSVGSEMSYNQLKAAFVGCVEHQVYEAGTLVVGLTAFASHLQGNFLVKLIYRVFIGQII